MQVDVGQQRRYHTPLRRARLGAVYHASLEHSRTEPFPDEAHDHPIDYPLAKQFPQLLVVEVVEETSHVRVRNPAAAHAAQTRHQGFQGIMRRAPGSKAIREIVEILLVQRLQKHRH